MRCYTEMKAVQVLARTQIKLNLGTSASYQNWKGLHLKYKGTFFCYELAISLYKLNFRQAKLFWGFNLYSLYTSVLTFLHDEWNTKGTQTSNKFKLLLNLLRRISEWNYTFQRQTEMELQQAAQGRMFLYTLSTSGKELVKFTVREADIDIPQSIHYSLLYIMCVDVKSRY